MSASDMKWLPLLEPRFLSDKKSYETLLISKAQTWITSWSDAHVLCYSDDLWPDL